MSAVDRERKRAGVDGQGVEAHASQVRIFGTSTGSQRGKALCGELRLNYRTGAVAMLRTSVAELVLSALVTVTRTEEVRRNLELDLFEFDLLDSLGVVELMVLLADNLGLDLSPAEIDRAEWSTPARIVAYVEGRLRR